MSTRHLHINIFDAGRGGSRRRFSAGRPTDPDDSEIFLDPTDPDDSEIFLDPTDPDDSEIFLDPTDPDRRHRGGRTRLHRLRVAAFESRAMPRVVCCGCHGEDEAPIPDPPGIGPRDHSGFLIVRVAPGVGPLAVDSLWQLAESAGFEALKAVLELEFEEEDEEERASSAAPESGGSPAGEGDTDDEETPSPEPRGALVSRPLVQLRGRSRQVTVDLVAGCERLAARTSLRPRHSLNQYWRVDLRQHPDRVEEVLERFSALAEVDLAYREVKAIDTAQAPATAAGPALAGDQSYLDPAPEGIGARPVRDLLLESGLDPELVSVLDLEQGWLPAHVELAGRSQLGELVFGENREEDEDGAGHHGTAVLGQLAGEERLTGAGAGLVDVSVASHYRRRLEPGEEPSLENPFPGTNGHVAAAIMNGLIGADGEPSAIGKGQILLLEVQRGRLPTEIDEADFDAVRLATALGVTVIEAAGNGNFDLDRWVEPQTGRTLRRGARGFVDSGAVLVGAAFSALPHDRAPFSNYGSRVDCYGWGEGVTTCGYGDLSGIQPTEYYTNTFGGTSSAAPILAGAAALLQGLHHLRAGGPLMPIPMRALLASRATGTPQGPNVGGHIGVMPDLGALVRDVLRLVPDVYLRHHPGDDGGGSAAADPIAASPDLVVLGTGSTAELDETGAWAHHPAPGDPTATEGSLFVRLRNRGGGDGEARVLLYASPAATLVPPECWRPVGSVELDVPLGDLLAVSEAVEWRDPAAPAGGWPQGERAYSLLAVLAPEEDRPSSAPPVSDEVAAMRALPPGGSQLDWRRWVAFLRGSRAAWRNVHPIEPAGQAELGFFLTGTPDRGRSFDFEVVQRLPADAEVVLRLDEATAMKLAQRQPALARDGGSLTLPRRHATRFSRVRLPAGFSAPASFEISGAALASGHSLTLRQLWRGEEVGRIAWHVR